MQRLFYFSLKRSSTAAKLPHHQSHFSFLSKPPPPPPPPQPPQLSNTHFNSLFLSPHSLKPCLHYQTQIQSQSRKLLYQFLPNPLIQRSLLSSFSNELIKIKRGIKFIRSYHKGYKWSYGGVSHNWKPSWFTSDNIVMRLILINVAVFMLWRILSPAFMMSNFTISLDNFTSGHVHTLITSAFSHVSMGHLLSNMIGLYFFGNNINRVFGPQFLLKLYIAGALGGSVFYLIYHAYLATQTKNRGLFDVDPSRARGMGASAAVNAIMLLDIFLFPKATLYFDFIFPVPAILLGVFLIGKDVLRIIEGDSEISGSAHLGGAAVAAIAWAGVKRGRF